MKFYPMDVEMDSDEVSLIKAHVQCWLDKGVL